MALPYWITHLSARPASFGSTRPFTLRAARLFMRPWTFLGKTRPEIPDGNVDWPLQQYRFALRSLRNDTEKRDSLAAYLADAPVWHCRTPEDVTRALSNSSSGN